MKQRGIWLVLIAANLLILFVALPTAWSSPTRQSAPTPTSTATVFAEALNPDANIRNQPSINGDRIGTIQPGESYPVRGYNFEWLLIEFPASPNGYAWVHQSVVSLIGDRTGLPQIDPAALPSTRPPTNTPIENAAAITTTPTIELPQVTLTPTATIPGLDFTTLQREILTYLASRGIVYNGPNSVVSIYVQDLETGAAMGIQENVLQNAVSTAKIGVIANYFRYIFQPPNQDMEFRLAATVICSSNANANVLMESTDPVDPLNGIRRTVAKKASRGESTGSGNQGSGGLTHDSGMTIPLAWASADRVAMAATRRSRSRSVLPMVTISSTL